MRQIDTVFVTKIYRADLAGEAEPALNADLVKAARAIARDDTAGISWSRAHGYKGYTSYASLADLPVREPAVAALKRHLDRHAALFATEVAFDLGRRRLKLDSLWINVLEPGGVHTGHIHPHSIISGTYYVAVPDGASAIRFEDPRLCLMMAAPPRRSDTGLDQRAFVSITPQAGTLLLWESWLRHEVPLNECRQNRVSISFNYRWG
jgi:uncharacterized protein (TIGR02466 family)